MQGMETAYVGNGVSASDASITVGTEVIKAVAQKYQTNNQIGKATIEIDGFGTIENVTGNATVSVYTTDFIVEGTIYKDGGQLTWGEIDENKPGIIFNISSPLTIYEDSVQDVTATLKQFTANTVTWTSSDDTKVTVTPKTDTKQATINGIAKTTSNVTITASAGGYSSIIEVKVEELDKISTKKPASSSTTFSALSTSGTTTLKDEVGNKVKVPKNFRLAADTGVYVQDGVVIEDSIGNQFVWVPVGTIKKATNKSTNPITTTNVTIPLGRYETFTLQNGNYVPKQGLTNGAYTTTTSEYKISSYYYEFKDSTESSNSTSIGATDASITYGNTKSNNIQAFVESANTNSGYYIARYEAGISGTTDNNSLTTQTAVDGSVKPKIKSGCGVWNAITQKDASTVCQNMYSGVTSDLMNSYAWDTAIIFIQQCANSSYANSYRLQSGLTTTGNSRGGSTYDNQCNIYDMAGNVREWTTESSTETGSPCVGRGGGSNYGNYNTTSYRYNNSTTDTDSYFGFRPILYL